MSATLKIARRDLKITYKNTSDKRDYRIILILIAGGSFLLIYSFLGNIEGFMQLINLATSISFVMAPFVAIFNLLLMKEKYIGADFVPPLWMRILAWMGIVFLSGFTFYFIFKDQIIQYLT